MRALAAADFTGQGTLSLVVQLNDPSAVDANFVGVFSGSDLESVATRYLNIGGPYSTAENVVVADFNRDGFLDVATVTSGMAPGAPSSVAISLNTGNTTTPAFAAPYTVPGSTSIPQSGLHSLMVGDFNGDGNPDLASAGLIFFGNGDGTFSTSSGNLGPEFLLAGDFNNDGKTDLISINTSTQIPQFAMLLQVPPPADFSLALSKSALTRGPNQASDLTVTLQALSGFSSDVALSVSGLPLGITPTFLPGTVPGGNGFSNLELAVGTDVALGTYTITVTAVGGGITHSSTFTLMVNPNAGDFIETVAPTKLSVYADQSAEFTVAISPLDGFTGDVALTLSGTLPPGSTYRFSSPIVTGGIGISTLTIAVPGGLMPGMSYVAFVTITAASRTIAKSQTIALSIDTPAPPPPPPPPMQHTVHLAWNASTSQAAGYLVYRSTVSGSGYTLLNLQPISTLSYDDSTVASGTTYYYAVTAVNASGQQSTYSNMATAVVPSP